MSRGTGKAVDRGLDLAGDPPKERGRRDRGVLREREEEERERDQRRHTKKGLG